MATVLDLPIEKQREIAKLRGKSLEQWRKDTAEFLAAAKAHVAEMDKNPPYQFPSKEREAEFHRRYDSEERGVKVLKIEDLNRWMVDDPLP